MKKTIAPLAVAALLVACSNNNTEQNYVPLTEVLSTNSGQPVVGASQNAPAGTARLNPAHGQPGHRCDLDVGAPLPEEATAPAPAPVSEPQPVITQVTPEPVKTTTAAGMNPEHGQPGHRCDIAVGAPLSSKPQTTTITPASTASTKAAPGMNPAHGEPGHRCDIAVGAPLNSADKKDAPIEAKLVEKDSGQ